MSRPRSAGLKQRIETVEEAYEFMLAYAAQGLSGNEEGGSVTAIREQLERADGALDGLADRLEDLVEKKKLKPAAPYRSFIRVIARDAGDARAAIGLVLAQPAISSQLIDNVNASIHLRALLTDLFIIDESLKQKT